MRYQNLEKFELPNGFRGRSAIYVQLWWLIQATLFAWSPQFAYGWRRLLLKIFGAKIGKIVIIRPSVKLTYPWKVKIGDNSWIGDEVILYSLGEIIIGSDSVISQKSYICTGSHSTYSPEFKIFAKPIRIGNQCWIATDVFIAPGMTIGDGAVVGARSSVFNDIPAEMICMGSPAEPVKRRSSKQEKTFL